LKGGEEALINRQIREHEGAIILERKRPEVKDKKVEYKRILVGARDSKCDNLREKAK